MEAVDCVRRWVEDFVIGHHLCPFAAPYIKIKALHYRLSGVVALEERLMELYDELEYLEGSKEHRTSLLIYNDDALDFDHYLELLELAEDLIEEQGLEYQLASFHPDYCFEDAQPEDPANLSNRSPYPMIHILRLDDVARAVAQHPNTHEIPQRNIDYLRSHFQRKE